MATRKKTSGNRATLVDGCGTILKTNRLKGGYKLVKRKKSVGTATATDSATAPAKRRGRPAKAKVTASATTTAPAKRRGRPAKAKVTESAPVTVVAKRRGRPAKAKVTESAPATVVAKRRGRKKSTATASTMKPSVKMGAKKSTRGRRKKTAKA